MPALTPPQGIDGLQVRSAASHRLGALAGRTQEALYAEIDLELSWSEAELPQAERTKHVHSIHPYQERDRKSTRLNSSHTVISYAVFCLKKKKKKKKKKKQKTKKNI